MAAVTKSFSSVSSPQKKGGFAPVVAITSQPRISDADRFDATYRDAQGDPSCIPWADNRANPALITWLGAVAPRLLRCGSRVAVVGCGLGHDAVALIERGYDVTAFDISPTAIAWAKQRHPRHCSAFHMADLFDPPSRWVHRFELVVEIYTVQSLHPSRRSEALTALANLVARHGHMLMICRAAREPVPIESGPPWAITQDELVCTAAVAGLEPVVGALHTFADDEDPPIERTRVLFRRAKI